MIGLTILKTALLLVIMLTAVSYVAYAERRLLAFIQVRRGPNRVGPAGLLQPLADALKFVFKESILPSRADRLIYLLAPLMAMVPALMTFAVIPVGGLGSQPVLITDVNVALLYVLALGSLGVYGIILGGWASGSKYSILGALRSTAQLVSYELSLGVAVMGVILLSGTLSLVGIVEQQRQFTWFVFLQPLGFILFFIAAIAETNRVPFDLPEAETELVAGYHTEYSGMRFAFYYLAEYANMITASALLTTLYFGGWLPPPIPWSWLDQIPGLVWFLLKLGLFLFLYIWIRATLPRLRYDRLMDLGWKWLLPLGLVNLAVTAVVMAVVGFR
ncbi:MAG: NADH-quinone oxidoreductase subunit NuoH [Deinococcus sp.]|nr:NADH-quinone oxidoreductase subunit NuoH [Deinococcus sp.]